MVETMLSKIACKVLTIIRSGGGQSWEINGVFNYVSLSGAGSPDVRKPS